MAKSSNRTARIPIHSLSGGVARQAPSKRLPSEVEEADNVVLSLERSAEKRPPFSHIPTDKADGSLSIKYLDGERNTEEGAKAVATITVPSLYSLDDFDNKTLTITDNGAAGVLPISSTFTFDKDVHATQDGVKATAIFKFHATAGAEYVFGIVPYLKITANYNAGTISKYFRLTTTQTDINADQSTITNEAGVDVQAWYVKLDDGAGGEATNVQRVANFKAAIDDAFGVNAFQFTQTDHGSNVASLTVEQYLPGAAGNTAIVDTVRGFHVPDDVISGTALQITNHSCLGGGTTGNEYSNPCSDCGSFTNGTDGSSSSVIGIKNLTHGTPGEGAKLIAAAIENSIGYAVALSTNKLNVSVSRTNNVVTVTQLTGGEAGNATSSLVKLSGTVIKENAEQDQAAALGSVTFTSATASDYTNKVVNITDTSNRTIEFKFIDASFGSEGAYVKTDATHYTCNLNGISSQADFAQRFKNVVALSKTNGDFSITASYTSSATVVNLAQDVASRRGNTAITSDVDGEFATTTIAFHKDTLASNSGLHTKDITLNDGSSTQAFTFDNTSTSLTSGVVGIKVTETDSGGSTAYLKGRCISERFSKAINLHSINITASDAIFNSSSNTYVVTLTQDAAGTAGNTAITDTVTDSNVTITTPFSGGSVAKLTIASFTGGTGNQVTGVDFAGGDDAAMPSYNTDNLYYHFLDVDGSHRYCIVINRAIQNTSSNDLINIYRMEPTEWVKETVDLTTLDSCMRSYILSNNMQGDITDSTGNSLQIKDILGSIDYGKGIVLFNKHEKMAFLPDNSNKPSSGLNHAGDSFKYKIADALFDGTQPDWNTENLPALCAEGCGNVNENNIVETTFDDETGEPVYVYEDLGCLDTDLLCTLWSSNGGIRNVDEDIESRVNTSSLTTYEIGHSRENFSKFEIPKPNDWNSFMGHRAGTSINHLYSSGIASKSWTRLGETVTCPPNPFRDGNELDSYYGRDRGEIWYAREGFFSFPQGFYRVIRDSSPFFQRIRSENEKSVIDHTTFPLNIHKDDTSGEWKFRYLPLSPRVSGSHDSNPGPEAIKNNESIKGMCFWKNRLWIAAESTIFSSRIGEYFDFFLNDFQNLVESDPIDLTVNVGRYNVISHMIPFQGYIFLTAENGTQFELRGGGTSGSVTPTSIELRPTAFYTTATNMTPVTMGTKIYFFDAQKLFLYSGAETFGYEFSTAYELSEHCRGYIPKNFKYVTTSSATNTIFMADQDKGNELFLYTNRITEKGQMQQNCFFKWKLDSNDTIESMHGFEGDMYVLVKRTNGETNSLYPYHISLTSVPENTPLIDRLSKVGPNKISYDGNTNITTVTLPYYDTKADEIILSEDWDYTNSSETVSKKQAFTRLSPLQTQTVDHGDYWITKVLIAGNWLSQNIVTSGADTFVNRSLYVGRSYDMNIQLSTIMKRDQQNNAVDGVLNLKRITTRHHNTGQYTLEVERRGRTSTTVRSESITLGDSTDKLGETRIDSEGELMSKILSPADSTKIFIKSNFPTPCNITNIEVLGNFRPYASSSTQQ